MENKTMRKERHQVIIELPEELHKVIKKWCIDNNKTIKGLVAEFLIKKFK